MAWEEAVTGIASGLNHAIENAANLQGMAYRGQQMRQAVAAEERAVSQEKRTEAAFNTQQVISGLQLEQEQMKLKEAKLDMAPSIVLSNMFPGIDKMDPIQKKAFEDTAKRLGAVEIGSEGNKVLAASPNTIRRIRDSQRLQLEFGVGVLNGTVNSLIFQMNDTDGKIKKLNEKTEKAMERLRASNLDDDAVKAQMYQDQDWQELQGLVKNQKGLRKQYLDTNNALEEMRGALKNDIMSTTAMMQKQAEVGIDVMKEGLKAQVKSEVELPGKMAVEGAKAKARQEVVAQQIEAADRRAELAARTRLQAANIAASGAGGWERQTPEDKAVWYETYEKTGKLPPFAYRDSNSRNEFTKGFAEYVRSKGNKGADVIAERAKVRAQTMAMGDITKREALQGTFTGKIDENLKTLERMRSKYGVNYQRWANMPINKLQEFIGSGDLASLKLVLKSISNEVAKVESGSLGIAEVSVDQAKYMEKVHDVNMSFSDLMQVANTSKELGQNARTALKNQKAELEAEMRGDKPKRPQGNLNPNYQKGVDFLKAAKSTEDRIKRVSQLKDEAKWSQEEVRKMLEDALK